MNPIEHYANQINRRTFLRRSGAGIGMAALASLLSEQAMGLTAGGVRPPTTAPAGTPGPNGLRHAVAGLPGLPHFPAKAKRIIYLFQSGAPSQLDLFDYKPDLQKRRAQDLPAEVRMGQRLTGMTSGQKAFPVAPSIFKFNRAGKCGMYLSELLPHISTVADDICLIKTMYTEAINHDPAITFFQTGSQLAGRPSMGSWLSYGLGSENADLPSFVVLTSKGTGRTDDQPLYDRLWGAGFLPSKFQGVKFRNAGDPVLYLSDPTGVDRATRRSTLDELDKLNEIKHDAMGDPEIQTRIAAMPMLAWKAQNVRQHLQTRKG